VIREIRRDGPSGVPGLDPRLRPSPLGPRAGRVRGPLQPGAAPSGRRPRRAHCLPAGERHHYSHPAGRSPRWSDPRVPPSGLITQGSSCRAAASQPDRRLRGELSAQSPPCPGSRRGDGLAGADDERSMTPGCRALDNQAVTPRNLRGCTPRATRRSCRLSCRLRGTRKASPSLPVGTSGISNQASTKHA
jgi:hypothetical protein